MILIGELAEKANISKRTLYHYEQIGLLKPTVIAENRYRYYDENAIFHLQKILLLKSIGYTLVQIKGLLLQNQNNDLIKTNWITSLNEQIELIEKEKEEMERKQYYLRSTIHAIQLKGTIEAQEILQFIQELGNRPLVEGVIPAQFDDNISLTQKEKDILNHLPVFGSDDERLKDILMIYEQIRGMMHQSPYSLEAQEIAGKLYQRALELFDNNEELLEKYWDMISVQEDSEPVIIGMDSDFMSYIDEMMVFFLKQRRDED